MLQDIVTAGLDLAKNVFQVHAIDEAGGIVVRRQLRRTEVLKFFAALPQCVVGMEACASAHYWGRELTELGHEVRLMPPAYEKPYVKRGKTDAADTEAICEAVTRPTMRFVAVKTPEQQAVLMLHRTRDLLVRQRTGLINALRAHLAEYGIISSKGPGGVAALMTCCTRSKDDCHSMRDRHCIPSAHNFVHWPAKSSGLRRIFLAGIVLTMRAAGLPLSPA